MQEARPRDFCAYALAALLQPGHLSPDGLNKRAEQAETRDPNTRRRLLNKAFEQKLEQGLNIGVCGIARGITSPRSPLPRRHVHWGREAALNKIEQGGLNKIEQRDFPPELGKTTIRAPRATNPKKPDGSKGPKIQGSLEGVLKDAGYTADQVFKY